MKTEHLLIHSILAAFALASTASAADANPVYTYQAERAKTQPAANRARVEADLKAAGLSASGVVWYVVPAMSDVMRLADTFPEDGAFRGEVVAVLAKGEYEPASFELFAFDACKDVQLAVSDLKAKNGAVLPADRVDLTVSKPWFQNGNGWVSYFSDVGLKLTPELLLHDENLIRTELDPARPANYARLTVEENGRKTTKFQWISAPRDIGTLLPIFNEGFADAETLLPVALEKNLFKQFMATVHAPANQAPGVYRGTINATCGGRILAEIPFAVRVLPFELPAPSPYENIDAPFYVSLMSHNFNRSWILKKANGDAALSDEIWERSLRSYRAHNLLNPDMDLFAPGMAGEAERRRYAEIGFDTNIVHANGGEVGFKWQGLNYGGRLAYTQYRYLQHAIEQNVKTFNAYYPGSICWQAYGDEPPVGFVQAYRKAWEYTLGTPLFMTVAGHAAVFNKGGYVYRGNPMGGYPDGADMRQLLDNWKQIDRDMFVNFYAGQHNGSENPQFVRYQHGLLGYLSGLTGVYNYEFAIGDTHYNDLSGDTYKPMAVSYLCRSGLLETFGYLGFREAIDDIRYMTLLKRLCRDAEATGKRENIAAARKALLWIALLERQRMDLNAVRQEVTEYILDLQALLAAK